jgi:hypothetical protein
MTFLVPHRSRQTRPLVRSVLWCGEKDAASSREIRQLGAKLLLECRIIHRSARFCRQAVSLRQKPFAIGKVDGEDRRTVAA